MKSNRILIIGGNGYIGSRLTNHLRNQYSVTTLDRKINPNTENYNVIELSTISSYDTIIVLAGNSSVASCSGLFSSTFNNNVVNFERLLNMIAFNNLNIKVIYASSSSVYNEQLNALEFNKLSTPINNYDASKQMIDLIANRYMDDIELYGLRFGTVCGYSPNMRWDLIINAMYRSAKVNNEVNIINGLSKRPILAMADLCSAICRILENPESDYRGIYNLASGNYTFEHIGQEVAKLMDVTKNSCTGIGSPYSFTMLSTLFNYTFGPSPLKSSIKNIIDDLNINNAII